MRNRRGRQRCNPVGREIRCQIAGDRAPVVTEEEGPLLPERTDQAHDVLGDGTQAVVAVPGRGARRIAAHGRRHGAVAGPREGIELSFEGLTGVGETVETEHERPLPRLEIVQVHRADGDLAGTHAHAFSRALDATLDEGRGSSSTGQPR